MRCTTCGHTFTPVHGHPLYPLRTGERTIAQILLDLARRRSIHETADQAGVSINTVQNVVRHMQKKQKDLPKLLVRVLRMRPSQAQDVRHFLIHRDQLKRKNRFA